MTTDHDDDNGPSGRPRRRLPRAAAVGLGILGVGVAATGVAATAGATTSSGSPVGHHRSPAGAMPWGPPPLSGRVTAIGASSVTIKTSAGTTTYAVSSSTDIDKNGEASLSDLVVGDAVTFRTVMSGGTTIAVLHAGNERLDLPPGGPSRAFAPPPLTGMVTAVGTSSVTIRTSAGTST